METLDNNWHLPIPGDVMQAINPWSWWTNAMGQFGLVNITTGASSNPQVEREIVGKVAGYGRQLGRISEALYALLAHMNETSFTATERRAVADFRRMTDDIAAVKARYAAPTDAAIDDLIDGINFLKGRNVGEYERVVGRLRKALLEVDRPAMEKERQLPVKRRPTR